TRDSWADEDEVRAGIDQPLRFYPCELAAGRLDHNIDEHPMMGNGRGHRPACFAHREFDPDRRLAARNDEGRHSATLASMSNEHLIMRKPIFCELRSLIKVLENFDQLLMSNQGPNVAVFALNFGQKGLISFDFLG